MWSYSFYARGANKNGKDAGGYFLLCWSPPPPPTLEKRLRKTTNQNSVEGMGRRGRACGSHLPPLLPPLLQKICTQSGTSKTKKRTQTNSSQMTRWMRQGAALLEKVRSDATLNTQPVFIGRRRECEECLPSEPMPRVMALIKKVSRGCRWNRHRGRINAGNPRHL